MEGSYDYYKLYLVGTYIPVPLQLRTTAGTEPDHYPIDVYDVNGDLISQANNKAEYIESWNSASDNAVLGVLVGGDGPFSFILNLKPDQSLPTGITGDPVHVFAGIFNNQFGSEYN